MADPKVDVKADAKVDTSAAVAPVPAPEPKKDEAKPEEKKDSSVPVQFDYKSVYISPEFAYTWRGFQNNAEDTHKGPGGGFTIGYPSLVFGDRFYLRVPELTWRHESVSREIKPEFGTPIDSKASIDSILFGLTFGANIWKYIGAELSGRAGAAHAKSTADNNGKSGLRYHDNRFAYSVDNWGPAVEGQLALTVPEQKINNWLAIGGKIFGGVGKSFWQFVPDSISRPASDPEIPVGSTYGFFGLGVTGRFGEAAKIYPNRPEDKGSSDAGKSEDKTTTPAPAVTPPPAPVPAGVKAIQDMVEPMKTDVAKVMATEPAKNAAGYAELATKGAASKKKDEQLMAKDATESAVGEYRKAAAGYKAATEAVAKAEAALAELKKDSSIKPEEMKLAEEAVASMKTEADKLKEETGKAYKSASDAVKAYNGIKGLQKKDKIDFTEKDPTVPAEEPKPKAPEKAKGGAVK